MLDDAGKGDCHSNGVQRSNEDDQRQRANDKYLSALCKLMERRGGLSRGLDIGTDQLFCWAASAWLGLWRRRLRQRRRRMASSRR